MAKAMPQSQGRRGLLEFRLAYHLRCLREDATDPAASPLERLALVRDRAARIQEIRRALTPPAPLANDNDVNRHA